MCVCVRVREGGWGGGGGQGPQRVSDNNFEEDETITTIIPLGDRGPEIDQVQHCNNTTQGQGERETKTQASVAETIARKQPTTRPNRLRTVFVLQGTTDNCGNHDHNFGGDD